MKNILVGIDFHENTERLLEKAFELAQALGAKIWLLHVAAPDPDFVGYEVGPQSIRDNRAKELKQERQLLAKYARELQEKKVEAEGLLIQGATLDMILEESKKLDIDLIITGHHDRSFLYHAFFGSVSAGIIKSSKIPVLVIPNGS